MAKTYLDSPKWPEELVEKNWETVFYQEIYETKYIIEKNIKTDYNNEFKKIIDNFKIDILEYPNQILPQLFSIINIDFKNIGSSYRMNLNEINYIVWKFYDYLYYISDNNNTDLISKIMSNLSYDKWYWWLKFNRNHYIYTKKNKVMIEVKGFK